jgi:transcriptional regulator with XRE-family HTH domain
MDCMDGNPKILFGQRLRTLRKERNLSQEDLALEAGLDRTYISGIEIGKRNVALVNICKLAVALGVPTSYLFEFETQTQVSTPQIDETQLPLEM